MSAHSYSHNWHESHPGYHPAQVLHDNCDTCLERSRSPWMAIHALESDAFEAAWLRALEWNSGKVRNVSETELPVLQVFIGMSAQLAKRGVPWGTVPAGEKAGSAAAA